MNIDRHNYEEYFLLYTDNELNAREQQAVEEFAAMNPDLQQELAALQQYKLVPDEVVFPGKATLLKTAGSHFINENNYEERFLLYADRELNDKERASVEQFVQDKPALKQEFELISQAVLAADRSVQFSNKEALLRHEEVKVVLVAWWKMAAAAVFILAAGSLWLSTRHLATQQPVAQQKVNHSSRQQFASGSKPAENKAVVKQPSPGPAPLPGTAYASAGKVPATSGAVQHGQKKPSGRDVVMSVAKLDKHIHSAQPQPAQNAQQVHTGKDIAINSIIPAEIPGQRPVTDEPASFTNAADVADTKPSNVTFASNNDAGDVYISNIPFDQKHALRGLFRKASRIINKATGLNTGERGNPDIAQK